MLKWEWGLSADIKDEKIKDSSNMKNMMVPLVFRKEFFKHDGHPKKKGKNKKSILKS